MKRILFVAVLFFVAACSSTKSTGSKSSSGDDVARGAAKFPGYTQEEFSRGNGIYTKYCNACHGLKDPQLYNEEALRSIVPNMVVKTNKKLGMVIDDKDEQTLLKYLITMSTSGKK